MKWFGSWVSDKVCVIVHGAMIRSSGGGCRETSNLGKTSSWESILKG